MSSRETKRRNFIIALKNYIKAVSDGEPSIVVFTMQEELFEQLNEILP